MIHGEQNVKFSNYRLLTELTILMPRVAECFFCVFIHIFLLSQFNFIISV